MFISQYDQSGEGTTAMGKKSMVHGISNMHIFVVAVTLIVLLCSSSISIPISESFFDAEANLQVIALCKTR